MNHLSLLITITAVLLIGCSRTEQSTVTTTAEPPSVSPVDEAVEVAFYTVDDYDPARDATADLAMTVEQASADGKRIILEIGGQW